MAKPKPPLRTDDKYIAGVKRIDASPEDIAGAMRGSAPDLQQTADNSPTARPKPKSKPKK